MSRVTPDAAKQETSPAILPPSPGSVLPARYVPLVAGYARGPFIDPATVTPTDWRWHDARTYIVRGRDGLDYRCVRVASEGVYIGYWAVELLGKPLPPTEWEWRMAAPFEWYDYRAIKSRNALISIVGGPPSIGKTWGAKAKAVESALKTGKQVMWVRRNLIELTYAKAGFFDSIAEQHPGFDFRVEGHAGQVRMDGGTWRTIIRFAALSTSYQMKGTEFPEVDLIVYDECFAAPGMRYLVDEVERLRRLWITVNRQRVGRDGRARTRVWMLGNPIQLDNPYFLEWGFDESREWQKGKGTNGDVVLHLVDAEKYERRVVETVYGKALGLAQTIYAEGDYFISDGGYVVEDRPADSKPFATLVTLDGVFGLWEATDWQTMYVTTGPLAEETVPVVAFEPLAVRPGVILADAQHFVRKTSRRHYRRGSMFLVGQAAMPARKALAR